MKFQIPKISWFYLYLLTFNLILYQLFSSDDVFTTSFKHSSGTWLPDISHMVIILHTWYAVVITNFRLTSRFIFTFTTFAVTIQTTRVSNTKHSRQLSCSTLYSCCYRDPRYSSDDRAGLAFRGERIHPVPCMPEECKQKAVSTTYTCIFFLPSLWKSSMELWYIWLKVQ